MSIVVVDRAHDVAADLILLADSGFRHASGCDCRYSRNHLDPILHALATLDTYKTGVHRPTLSASDIPARQWFASRIREAGLDAEIDGIANILGKGRASSRKVLADRTLKARTMQVGSMGHLAASMRLKPRCPLDQGKDRRCQTAAEANPRLVDQNQTADGGRKRDLALFNLAIDSKLRGCDVVAIRVASRANAIQDNLAQDAGWRRP